jgi:antitoxin component YwqK of YwqJK toxin-antitoxin module
MERIFFFLHLVLLPVICFGQKNEMRVEQVKQDKNYFSVYYSNKDQKMINGKPYTGIDSSTFVFEGEHLTVAETFKEGFKTEVKTFYDNHQPECHFQFKNGKRDGISKKWYKSGKIMFDNPMKDGKEIGIHITFYENGLPDYIKDEEHGISIGFHESGKVSSISQDIEDSVKCGGKDGYEEKTFYKDGQLRTKGVYNCGKQMYTIYANDSIPIAESNFIGMPLFKVGKYKEYYNNGTPKLDGQYVDAQNARASNIKTGVWKYWDEKGKLMKEEYYENNKLIKTEEYIKGKKVMKIKG